MLNKKGKIAVGEVLVLIIAIFAFGWIISSEIKIVKGDVLEDIANLGPKSAATKTGGEKAPGASGKVWIGTKIIAKNLAWAYTVYSSASWAAQKIGVDKDKAIIVGGATAATYFAVSYKTGATATSKGTPYIISKVFGTKAAAWVGKDVWLGITGGTLVTLAVFAVTTAIFYKNTKTKTVVFECKAWDAASGGNKCEQCNKNGILECSEYQCHALGQGCQLIEGKCIWKNEKDKDYPILTLDEGALLDDYEYKDKITNGVKIINKNSATGCVKAFTPLTFGVTTNEIATCKADYERKEFKDMKATVNRGYNHTVGLILPTQNMTDSLVIKNDGNYKIYLACQDENTNVNPTPFIFSFCVEEGPPSQTAPIIVATSIPESSPYVGYDTEEIDFSIGVNMPPYCKWDTQNKAYDDMTNVMTCGENTSEINLQMLFECSTTLTGIQKGDNTFYFRCKNRVEGGKANQNSYPFTIKRTQEKLSIDNTYSSPKETVRGSTELVKAELKIKTLKGADEGNAICYYGEDEDYKGGAFSSTNSYEHSQEQSLDSGTYKYYVKCVDAGGDVDTTTITFDVESDQGAPVITRLYKDGNELKIKTNENAECVYSKDKKLKCGYLFTDGTAMTTYDNLEHTAEWDVSSNYYIQCKDEYGNLPEGDCSMIVKPSS